MSGKLMVVATPIGNLEELSPRARQVLAGSDIVACEDTRRTGRLFDLAGIEPVPRLVSLHQHNESRRAEELVSRCRAGATVALASDAGMPTISDPGARLVDAMHDAGVDVGVVSGPSAVVSALAVSGFEADRFVFEGFLPRKGKQRTTVLEQIAHERRTVVFYESPHRVEATMSDLSAMCAPTRRSVIVRELSKLHEQLWRGRLADAARAVAESAPRGEYVVVIEGAEPAEPPTDDQLIVELDRLVDGGSSRRDAAAAVAERFGIARRRAYELVIER